ncbi:MAG: DUF3791 domain-containing protein [Proteobacteria bacterium]|nr:DUF3791 domain-containing protein [Pseudomonadota bacterium]
MGCRTPRTARAVKKRVIAIFAEKANITLEEALDFFYHSVEYQLLREGVSVLHCMSDDYLAEDLMEEFRNGVSQYCAKQASIRA